MLRSNKLESHVKLHEAALGEMASETTIQLEGGSQFRRTGLAGHPVAKVKLDSLIPPGKSVDLLKIDIEGGEYEVLQVHVAGYLAAANHFGVSSASSAERCNRSTEGQSI